MDQPQWTRLGDGLRVVKHIKKTLPTWNRAKAPCQPKAYCLLPAGRDKLPELPENNGGSKWEWDMNLG